MDIKLCDLCGEKITNINNKGVITIDCSQDIYFPWNKEIFECCNECTEKVLKPLKEKKKEIESQL